MGLVSVEKMFQIENDLFFPLLEKFDGITDHCQVFISGGFKDFFHMGIPGFTHYGHRRCFSVKEGLDMRV